MRRTPQVAIVGFGVLGQHVLHMLSESGPCRPVIFDDSRVASGDVEARAFADIDGPRYADHHFYVALGYRHLARKQEIQETLARAGRRMPTFVHATAYVDRTAYIEDGSIIFPKCNVGPGCQLGRGVVLHAGVTCAHDDQVGHATYISPGVVLSGFVSLAARVFLGAGTVVADRVRIGADAVVGIGTCVTHDVGSAESAIGNPMRKLTHPLRLR